MHGICYVAWGEHGINEAERSAWHVKGAPTCLITDDSQCNESMFSHVIRTDFAEYAGLHHFYRKMDAIRKSPFDVTMYADADTYPIGNLSLGFQKAARFQFAIVIAPGQVFDWLGVEYVHYNGGVLFFAGHPTQWADKVLSLARMFHESDEPAWTLAFDEMNINPAVLPSVYNRVLAGPIDDRPIRIWHSRHPLRRTLTWPDDPQ